MTQLGFCAIKGLNCGGQAKSSRSWLPMSSSMEVIDMKYVDLVNVQQGTNSVPSFSAGNILPVTGMPFGMSSFALETRPEATLFFNPNDKVTTGIRLTHTPSPWVNDYGDFVMMAQSGDRIYFDAARRSGFRLNETVMTPYELSVRFLQYRSELTLVPTTRGAACTATYDYPDVTHRLSMVNADQEVMLQIDPDTRKVSGYTRANTGCAPENFAEYFVMQFDCDFDMEKTVVGDRVGNRYDPSKSNTAPGLCLSLAFVGTEPKTVNYTMAISFISVEQAQLNLEREVAKSMDELRADAINEWEKHLSKLEIETDCEEQKKTFYTCLYRMFLFPRVFYEFDADNNMKHYSPADGSIRDGSMYSDNGFWDTYKTVYPLFSLILSDRYAEMVDGFLNFYDESGWLPKWLSPGERGYMPGTMIDPVLADAVVKGVITDRAKIEKALDGMIKHANTKPSAPVHGRNGIELYLKYGYVPDCVRESVNATLDYAYGDFCIARIAGLLGKTELQQEYAKRALNYQNIFDKETTFMRARNEKGEMRDDFTQFDWGGDYCEGGPWQNSFAVYHDFYGMAGLMGGRDKMIEKLDTLFATPPYYRPYGYSTEIHEMTEMAVRDFGQYAISNQPSFHIPYIYSCMGNKDKCSYWVRKVAREAFDSGVNGYPGDEDNGSMGGWYVFTTLGFYPVCPGSGEYVLGSPAVKKCTIHMDNGNDMVIDAANNSAENVYVKSLTLNDKPVETTYLSYEDIRSGGVMKAEMSDTPANATYTDDQLPFSLSR